MAMFKDPATKSIICMGVLLVLMFCSLMVFCIQWVSGDLLDPQSLTAWLRR